ncbi:MAG: 50S ribosomal protein L21 [Deltaproteobacteria bacterium]|nr:50S ribosomal protein L21 [Deltaproteobacteria bacterium]
MYAVVETGGKQYKVTVGQQLEVERLQGEVGSQVVLDKVLMVGGGQEVKIGRPMVDGVQVVGQIVAQGKARKIVVFKKKRRKGYRLTRGHRQLMTRLKILEIKAQETQS